QDIMIDLETLPFFSERNIAYVENPMFLRATNERTTVTHDVAVFQRYIENPAPYSTLIVVAPYDKLDRRKKITKVLLDKAVVIDCQPIRGNELRKWLNEILKTYHISMT